MTEVNMNTENYKFPMIKKFYSCYDKTGECYMGNFEAETDMRAIRFIEDAVKGGQSQMSNIQKTTVLIKYLKWT